jgi:flagellar protein FliS
MMRRLVEANTVNDPAVLDEVSRLMGEIREAWIAIRN